MIELLSRRELEVLQLIAQGRSDQEIAGQLVLALSTVKGHNRSIFGKLQVQAAHRSGRPCSRIGTIVVCPSFGSLA